ncbi:MAG: hypothetical protein IJK88_05305, partial [Clostridia bacterium]|nr:hypothetical protein [Clostridia bacterium]
PTEDMLEVAIASFELALHPPKGDLSFDPGTPLATEGGEPTEAQEAPDEPKEVPNEPQEETKE